jgi:uncharacterized protein (DUF2236 family)
MVLNDPALAALADQPSSPEDRASFQSYLDELRERLALIEDPAQQAELQREINALEGLLRNRTLAHELADEKAVLARDRWLAGILLEVWDEDSQAFLALDLGQSLPIDLLDQARPAIWRVLQQVRLAPFNLARLRKSRSGLPPR